MVAIAQQAANYGVISESSLLDNQIANSAKKHNFSN